MFVAAKKESWDSLDVVEKKILKDGWEDLRRLLCTMNWDRELPSLAEEIIQMEHLTQS